MSRDQHASRQRVVNQENVTWGTGDTIFPFLILLVPTRTGRDIRPSFEV